MAAGTQQPSACRRVPLSTATKRRLWSESGGYCQSPACSDFLFADDADVDFAQMAHIVGASTEGPRGKSSLTKVQRAHHSNVTVLCPKCHILVDSTPQNYPIELLHSWKARHQDLLAQAFGTPQFADRGAARRYIEPLLAQNGAIFVTYGPVEGNMSDERAALWRKHARQTIVPNNQRITRALTRNRDLLTAHERATADIFGLHVAEFDARHVLGDWTAGTQRFPEGMNSIMEDQP
ncbi:hypothetical protein SAMN04489867_3154 [Pedococcus dokdonensis]|uniref:HNH endonuclease n=1 Tax=Pedococcus dokdonensis TaxID=443156 RepID=A0A1H0U674_9MICO|nr:hypothetical protein [Pedococcus dokdonensis]SDP61693.1 hypothetical protein SAMN04489867_3154 [Pedococcus dokdonensis]